MTNQDNHEARKLLTESIGQKMADIETLIETAEGFERRAKSRHAKAGVLNAEIHGLEIALEGLGGRLTDE